MIIVEPGGKQKVNTGAQCNAGSSDEDDLDEGKRPLYHFGLTFVSPHSSWRENNFTLGQHVRDVGALLTLRFALQRVHINQQGRYWQPFRYVPERPTTGKLRFDRDTIRIIETPRYVPYWNGRSDGKSRPAKGARSGGAAP